MTKCFGERVGKIGGIYLNIRYAILQMLIIFLLTSGLALGQSVENSTSLDNSTLANLTDNSSTAEDLSAQAAASENTSANSSAQNLKYIWSITGIEDDPIIMALDQDGTDLFGKAKYEPDGGEAWNGIVDGSISGDAVKLTITAQMGKSLESIKLNGVLADDAISGNFTRIREGAIAGRGDFNALWISPDISGYEPAKVAESTTQKATQEVAQTTETAQTTTGASSGTTGASIIKITSSSFQPSLITVPTGATVTWVNSDSSDHTVTANNGEFGSGNLATGQEYTYTFTTAGTYDYYCQVTPAIKGRVIVTKPKVKYVDIHEYAEKIGPGGDLSGVPPGMGGSGL